MSEAKAHYLRGVQNITYVASKYEVLSDSDALVLLTEWKEFRSPDFDEIKAQLKKPIIFDGRNQYNAFRIEDKGFEYYQIEEDNEDISNWSSRFYCFILV